MKKAMTVSDVVEQINARIKELDEKIKKLQRLKDGCCNNTYRETGREIEWLENILNLNVEILAGMK